MKYFVMIVFMLFFTGCATGLGGFEKVVDSLSIENLENSGTMEAGCFEGEYTGTFTKSNIIYRKVVIPEDWPEGVTVPSCP